MNFVLGTIDVQGSTIVDCLRRCKIRFIDNLISEKFINLKAKNSFDSPKNIEKRFDGNNKHIESLEGLMYIYNFDV